MFEGSTYEAGHVQLNPGDALVMYSDGITEAESPDGQPFDEAGLERTLALYPGTFRKRPQPAGTGDFRRRRAPSARFAACRRPLGSRAEPAVSEFSPAGV